MHNSEDLASRWNWRHCPLVHESLVGMIDKQKLWELYGGSLDGLYVIKAPATSFSCFLPDTSALRYSTKNAAFTKSPEPFKSAPEHHITMQGSGGGRVRHFRNSAPVKYLVSGVTRKRRRIRHLIH